MKKLITSVKQFVKEEDAPTMVEYGLLISLIALVVAVGALFLGSGVSTLFADAESSL